MMVKYLLQKLKPYLDLKVIDKGIKNLKGIEGFTALIKLWCNNNQITSLDVSKNTALAVLYCENNKLTSLDVSKNTPLTQFYCHYNKLTRLNVSKNTKLTSLFCNNNKLTSLDLRNNSVLDMSKCTFINNPKLTCILVNDKAYNDVNWSNRKNAKVKYIENPADCN